MVASIIGHIDQLHGFTLVIGLATTWFLFWVRGHLKPLLKRLGFGPVLTDLLAKAGPVFAVAATTALVWVFGLDVQGVRIVGDIPQSLPPFTLPSFSPDLLQSLIGPAILISIIGFVESVSVAQTLAAKKRQRIDPNQELIGLGSANLGAAFTGGFPVTGGFSRSVVNFDAGAETPAAGIYTALGLGIASIALTPLVYIFPMRPLQPQSLLLFYLLLISPYCKKPGTTPVLTL